MGKIKIISRPDPNRLPDFQLPFHVRSVGCNESDCGWCEYVPGGKKLFVQVFWTLKGSGEITLPDRKIITREGEVFYHLPGEDHRRWGNNGTITGSRLTARARRILSRPMATDAIHATRESVRSNSFWNWNSCSGNAPPMRRDTPSPPPRRFLRLPEAGLRAGRGRMWSDALLRLRRNPPRIPVSVRFIWQRSSACTGLRSTAFSFRKWE